MDLDLTVVGQLRTAQKLLEKGVVPLSLPNTLDLMLQLIFEQGRRIIELEKRMQEVNPIYGVPEERMRIK